MGFLDSLDPDTSKLLGCAPKASTVFHIYKNHHVPMFARLQPLELSEERGSGRRIVFKSTSVGQIPPVMDSRLKKPKKIQY